MAQPNPRGDIQPIIIKKIKKHAGHGHHGGAWKVAYADFVTAMMAFFLLMWLLNATSDEQKMGISNYFDPIGISQGATGAGGVLGGQSVKSDGVLQDVTASPTVGPPLGSEGDAEEQGEGASIGHGLGGDHSMDKATGPVETIPAEPTEAEITEMQKKVEDFERKQFEEAEKELKQAIQNSPELKALAEHLIVDQTPEGLRIQIVDQAKQSMFPNGSSRMYSYTEKLIEYVAHIIIRLPNKISVAGHTDSKPFSKLSGYTNWELSTDRANASRRALLKAGIAPARIQAVVGKAATEPLDKKDTSSPVNRRISITLLRKSLTDQTTTLPKELQADSTDVTQAKAA